MKQIELLLLENVDNLGIVGDVVKVRPGYARNYLLPRGLATVPTQKAIERLAERRAEVEAELKAIRDKQTGIIKQLEEYELTLERAANEQGVLFGGVSQHDVAEALREAGYNVEDRWVRLGEQIKRLDTYHIPVVVDKELKTEIKLWVVSDKPAEELEPEAVEGEEEAAETGETEESQSPM
ncbi:MAG: 50S ribosomal protein L9 [Phycisphaeraceae bacterium]